MSDADAPFIAADVGGTHVRLALVRANGAQPVEVLAFRKYDCTDHATLADFIADFIAEHADAKIDRGVIASAGYALDDGTVIATNLPWPLSIRETCERLGFADLRLVNDFEAVAHAAAYVDASEVLRLAGPETVPPGPTLVVGPGTGLGAAVWIPTRHGPVVLATEAGQAALTAGTELEMAVLRIMLRERNHVPVEHALSGPGLMRLHAALCALHDAPGSEFATPGEITAAALSGEDARARESLALFCGMLGNAVGDMALLYGVHGGIYLAGGILPQIREFLLGSAFVERFLNKGPMREALERIPVKLVEHGQLGVIGAANWYLAKAGASKA